MISTVAYREDTGRIFYTMHVENMDCAIQSVDIGSYRVMQIEDGLLDSAGSQFYVRDGALVPRPASPVTLTGLRLDNLPVGGVLRINGTPYNLTDSAADLSFPLPGTYRLVVENFPALDAVFEVTV